MTSSRQRKCAQQQGFEWKLPLRGVLLIDALGAAHAGATEGAVRRAAGDGRRVAFLLIGEELQPSPMEVLVELEREIESLVGPEMGRFWAKPARPERLWSPAR